MKVSTLTTMAVLLAGSAAASNTTTDSNTTTSGSSTMTSTTSGCWEVSVEHDATYCIEGPICSGSGLEPAGSLCPVKGDVATADCHSYLASYAEDDSCALPVDTTCEVIKTGAWGCVLSSSSSASGEGDAGVGSESAAGNATITTLAATDAASAGGLSVGAVAGIAAVAAAVCAVAGVAIYNQHQKNAAEAEHVRQTTFVDVVTP